MSTNYPRSSNPAGWHDQDQYPAMSRLPSNSISSQRAMPVVQGHAGPRNGFGNGDKAVPVPGFGGDRKRAISGATPLFDMARSPPSGSSKNTKHVPCKFFRQGACQAGNACPFSHSLDPVTQQAPCKYFMKGNCKFGAKCALAHYLPDGRRVNRADLDAGLAAARQPLNTGFTDRAQHHHYLPQQDNGLADPMLQPQPYGPELFPGTGFLIDPEEVDAFQDRYNQYQPQSAFDSGVSSPPTSQFGSPPNDYLFPKSPTENIRTALNAPLPQSFDANGISHIAKYGPLGQSVPDKFGLRPTASSSLSRQLGSPPEPLLTIRNPNINTGANLGANLRNASPLALSPQAAPDESIGQRITNMHSQRIPKARGLSASVPRTHLGHDWEEGFGVETDLLPNSLHDEVLTPAEKMRRLSRPEQELGSKEYANALAIPSGTSSKVGSPPAGSPSRFSALWAEQREKKALETTTNNNGPSSLGHVGSPLRGQWLPPDSGPTSQLSGISQAMARMSIQRADSGGDVNGRRATSTGLRVTSAPVGRFERQISSPGSTSKKIDEEVEGVFFPMDGDDKAQSPRLMPLRDRTNGEMGWHRGST